MEIINVEFLPGVGAVGGGLEAGVLGVDRGRVGGEVREEGAKGWGHAFGEGCWD